MVSGRAGGSLRRGGRRQVVHQFAECLSEPPPPRRAEGVRLADVRGGDDLPRVRDDVVHVPAEAGRHVRRGRAAGPRVEAVQHHLLAVRREPEPVEQLDQVDRPEDGRDGQ